MYISSHTPQMGYPKLYVAFFRPRFGNYQHWVLYLDNDEEQLNIRGLWRASKL